MEGFCYGDVTVYRLVVEQEDSETWEEDAHQDWQDEYSCTGYLAVVPEEMVLGVTLYVTSCEIVWHYCYIVWH